MPLAYGIGGMINVPSGPIRGTGAPPTSFTGQLGQLYIDTSTSPPSVYVYNGQTWSLGGDEVATTSAEGIVQLSTYAQLATGTAPDDYYVPPANDVKTYVDSVAIAGAPVATETVAGIGQLATDAEAVAGTPSTGLLALLVTPSNLTPVFAAPPAIGGTTPASAAFTSVQATGVGTGNVMTSNTASSFGVTGAGIDVTVASTGGRVVVNGEEAAADAVRVLSAAGGLDVDVALQMSLVSSQNAADAIVINASAGGVDITAAGAAGEDIDLVCTAGSINLTAGESIATSMVFTNNGMDIVTTGAAGRDIDITNTGGSINIIATENNAGAIIVQANGGASERVTLLASQGTGADSINLESTAGGITLSAALASADAINLAASAGGVDIDGALQVNIASSQNAVDAIRIVASAGGIDIDAVGAATEDINITNTGGSIVLSATESAADAIKIEATAGGIDILASGASAGEDIDIIATGSSVNISATEDNSGAITIGTNGGTSERITVTCAQGTNAASIGLTSTAGGITLSGGLATADAINIVASAAGGGIDVDAGTAGFIVDTTGAISLDSAAASNFTVTGAFDLTLSTTLGSANISAGEDAADAIVLTASAGGIDVLATGAAGQDIDIVNTGGSVNIQATENVADSITIVSTAGGIDVTAAGAAGEDIDIVCTAGSINLTAGENIATSMVITNTGMDIVITGAAGQDFDLTNTGGSVNITATENVTDAIVINASGAASALQLDAGTGSVRIGTGLVLPVVSKANADTPYTVLGTDYFISCDTSAGVLTVTLPAATALAGRTYVIRDTGGNAAVNNITIGGGGTNLVGGGAAAATKTLSAAYSGAIVISNGTTWNYMYIA